MKNLLLLLLFSFLIISCSKKVYDPLNYENAKITFGSGGGFAGTETSYTLLDNGNLFELTSQRQSSEKLTKIDKNQVTQIFNNVKMFKFDELELNDPGNLYYFMEFKSNDGEINTLTWGNGSVEKHIKLMHSILLNTVPK